MKKQNKSNEQRGWISIMNALEQMQEFVARFQTLEDMKNSMKNKGNKYGDFTE